MTSQTFIITYWNGGPTKANYFGLHMTHHGITINENENWFSGSCGDSTTRKKDGYNYMKKPISVYDMTGRWKKVDKIEHLGSSTCVSFHYGGKRFLVSKDREFYVKAGNGRLTWKKACEITNNDYFMRFDGEKLRPTKVLLLSIYPSSFSYFDFPGFRKKGFLLADGFIVRSYS